LKVFFITHYTSLYGANKSLLELVSTLKESYNVIPMVLTPEYGSINEELKKMGIAQISVRFYPWVSIRTESLLKRKLKSVRKRLVNSWALKKIMNTIHDFSPDIIHSNSSVIDFGAILAYRLGIRHVWHVREFGELDYNLTFLDKRIRVRKCLNSKADRLIFISKALRDSYVDLLDDFRKAVVVYNGVDISDYFSASFERATASSQYTFLMMGIISESKGQYEALRAIKIAAEKKRNMRIKLLLAGGFSSDYKGFLDEYISSSNLSELVEFLGYVKDPRDVFTKCDAGIVCSRSEAFGRVTVEMMMSGLPVIVSNTGANCEIVENDQTGLVYQFGNPTDLADKMLELMNNPSKAKRIAERGRQIAINKFSSKRNAAELFAMYKEILDK